MKKGPILIKKFNKTKYEYTEGKDVEADIKKYVETTSKEDYHKILKKDNRWTVFYHLNDIRPAIVSWFPFDKKKSCLEIGGGMGAITSYLCDNCLDVTTVEMSEIRAETIVARNKDKNNLKVIVGDFKDIKFEQKFDYIVLIGVLEYQGKYSDTKNPYSDFLNMLKKLLKPKGTLLLAIENRFGLKYWCGTPEDHTAIPFDGINNYELSNAARTFSKHQLANIIEQAGFKNYQFFYPLPDYKLPQMIFSDKYLPGKNIKNRYREYHLDYRSLVLDESKILPDIIENGVFDFFANSFLVECSLGDLSDVMYATSTGDRKKDIQLTTIISKDKVIKKPMNEYSQKELEISYNNILDLEKRKLSIVPHKIVKNNIQMPYIKDKTLDEHLLSLAKENKIDEFYNSIDLFYKQILKSSDTTDKNILIDKKIIDKNIDCGVILKKGYIDLLFHNSFINGKKIMFFDQEFIEENVPANFMIYRSLRNLYYGNDWLEQIIPIDKIKEKYNLINVWTYYEKLDSIFLSDMKYEEVNKILLNYWNYDRTVIHNNYKNLLDIYSIDEINCLKDRINVLEGQLNHFKNRKIYKIYRKIKNILKKETK